MKKYKVWLRSVPGFYEQYDGFVDVYAEDEEDAVQRAKSKLKRETFPERDASMWKVTMVQSGD